MKNKKLMIVFCCLVQVVARPPSLPNFDYASNVCWNNAALQLLRNIEPFTEFLVADKDKEKPEYYGKDEFIDAYIDFLAASLADDQETVVTEIEKIYQGVCIRINRENVWTKQEVGKMGLADKTIQVIFKTFPDLVVKFLSVENDPTIKYDAIYHDEFFSYLNIEKNPPYLVIAIDDPQVYVNDPYRTTKTFAFDQDYEVVGYIDTTPGVHFWAFIKDFEIPSKWYKCDDSSIKEITGDITLQNPIYALYEKKEENTLEEQRRKEEDAKVAAQKVQNFADALASIAKV